MYNIWKHIWFWRKVCIVLWYIFFNFLFQKKNTFPESIRKEEDCSACSVRRLLLFIHSIYVALSRYYAQGTELSAEDSGEWRKSSPFTCFTCFMSSKKDSSIMQVVSEMRQIFFCSEIISTDTFLQLVAKWVQPVLSQSYFGWYKYSILQVCLLLFILDT